MKLSKRSSLYLFVLLVCLSGWAQRVVSGRVISDTGEPLAFATIYEEGTTNGTTSNPEGYYQLHLVNASSRIICQYIGYGKQAVSTQIDHLDFRLTPEALVLKEIIISAKDRDPAYYIIKQAIKKRKYYEDEVEAYSCDVYIKGLQRLDKKPKSLLGITITIDTGIVYLSESISKYKFRRPDLVSETMIASKLSGQSNGFSYNRASEMLINLYQNAFFIEGLSERSFISPIAGNAFLTYDYQLVGTVMEDTLLINKIRVTPKRASDPAFQGYIYIQENSWRIHSVDMMLTKNNGIEFVDSLKIFQVFAPTKEDIWMPLSQKFSYKFRAFGFAGTGIFTGVYSNYVVETNPKVYVKKLPHSSITSTEAPVKQPSKEAKKKKKEFGNVAQKIEEGSNTKDSIFWQTVRPVPLTSFEIKDYKRKDSLYTIKESKVYKDSVDLKKNKFKPANLIATGYTYHWSYKERYLTFPTLIQLFQYNTIEGFTPEVSLKFTHQVKQQTIWKVTPSFRYGFSNERFQGQLEGIYSIDRKSGQYLAGGFGRYVFQYNQNKPIAEFANSFQSLAFAHNFMKLYQKSFTYIGYSKEFQSGLKVYSKLEYAYRVQMDNTSTFTFDQSTDLTSNLPVNQELANTSFTNQTALIWGTTLRFTPGEKFIDRPDERFSLGSKYPTFELTYQKGIPGLAKANFDYIELSTKKSFKLGIYGISNLQLVGGAFPNTRSMTFIDYHHFNGNQIFIRQIQGDRHYQLLDYYNFSTQSRFIEAHAEHHFNGFIFNKVPLIKKLKWQAVGSVNYLNTSTLTNYMEFGFGIEHIFKFLRLDYYTSINSVDQRRFSFRLGAGF